MDDLYYNNHNSDDNETPASCNYNYYSQMTENTEPGTEYSPYDGPDGKPPKKKKSFGLKLVKAACLGLVFGLVSSGTFWAVSAATGLTLNKGETADNGLSGVNIVKTSSNGVSTIDGQDVSDIVEQSMPSIVAVSTEILTTQNYFGRTYSEKGSGAGSGIIISQADGLLYIVTNYHVIEDATKTQVTFNDNTTVDAIVKGYDETADIAVLTVDYDSLTQETKDAIAVAVIGDSSQLKVGNSSIAIGNALGYGMSVTSGPISALDREIQMTDGTMTLIQTQAAINPGNSGGALLNAKGEVIGINTVKYADTNVEGMGFAIPIDSAMETIEGIIDGTIVPQTDENTPYLGISGGTLDEETASKYGYPAGVYISMVSNGSAAERAGVSQGDILTAFNGTEVTTMEELQDLIAECQPGDQVTLTVQHLSNNGKMVEKELSTILGSKADVE